MKGASHPTNDVSLNPSSNESIQDVIHRVAMGRRQFLQGGVSAVALASAGGLTLGGLLQTVEAAPVRPGRGFPGIGFESVPASTNIATVGSAVTDVVRVPTGYNAQLFVAWGDPIMPGGAPFIGDASETAEQQERQFGEHNDGMHFFPLRSDSREYGERESDDEDDDNGKLKSQAGILCVNNEYTHEDILFPDGQVGAGYTLAKTRKSQAAHGVSILKARRKRGKWGVQRNSRFGRRITANTPVIFAGPAAGHALMQTNEYIVTGTGSVPTGNKTDGYSGLGTVNNCANGITPWGTYLTCEENFNGNFGANAPLPGTTANEAGKMYNRYGLTAAGFGYRWHTTDPRWDMAANPNEPNHFGWVVEIDPYDPRAKPVKRTAMGRFKHESAQYVVDKDDRVAFYMGDDERNEYIYKFVCKRPLNRKYERANRNLLNEGTLYVAKFGSDLTGRWIALVPGTIGVDGVALRGNPNFAGIDDAEVLAKILIKARMAGDAVGATMMDRPEWTGARPRIGGFGEVEVYCTLTNNNRRGSSATPTSNLADGSTTAGSSRPAVDAANPREDNVYGHIIRWREAGKSVTATSFAWDIFVQAGDTRSAKPAKPTNDYRGNIVDAPNGSADFGAPDGLWFDDFGRLWVQTDQVGDGSGDWVNIGANCMACADPNSGEMRRFLTSPNRCEVTGVTMTPDGRTMFVGIQHPGEDSTAADPTQFSNWPQGQFGVESDGVTTLPAGRPRSSVVVITRNDGGIIGS
jgi:secreted PhoX family phosphatase